MATNFPSSVDNFTNPTSNDSLNSPSHSLQHANANDAIEAIEGFLLNTYQPSFRNAIINGGFDIWQRGTTTAVPGYQTADRWYTDASASTTFSRESTIVPSDSLYSFKMLPTTSAQPYASQVIETANAIKFAGKTVTLSYQAQSSSAVSSLIQLDYSTSVDNGYSGSWTSITGTVVNNSILTTGFTKQSSVFNVPSSAKTLRVRVGGLNSTSATIYVGQVQLEVGSVSTPFEQRPIGTELALCQRYYFRANANGTLYGITSVGGGNSATQYFGDTYFPVTMRIAPTAIDYGTLSNYRIHNYSDSVSATPTALSIDTNIATNAVGRTVWTTSGLTANTMYYSRGNNNASTYLGFSAEL